MKMLQIVTDDNILANIPFVISQRIVERLPREILFVQLDDGLSVFEIPLGRLSPDIMSWGIAIENGIREVKGRVHATNKDWAQRGREKPYPLKMSSRLTLLMDSWVMIIIN